MVANAASFLDRVRQVSHQLDALSQEQVDKALSIMNDMEFTRASAVPSPS